MVSRGASTAVRGGGAHTSVKKAAVAAVAGVASGPEVVGDAEANTGAETAGLAEQQQSGEEDQPSVEDSIDDCAALEEQTHEDATPPADGDGTAEIELAQSQNLTAEEHPEARNGVLPEQSALPGEKEAENSVSETEAEAASEHESEAAPNAAEPEARLDEVKPRHATVGSELEDIVTMLQGPSFPASTHLDVAGEIPDEE